MKVVRQRPDADLFPEFKDRTFELIAQAGFRMRNELYLLNGTLVAAMAVHLMQRVNEVFASGQAIREASLTVLRPTVHGSETSRTQKRSLCGLAASSGVLNPRENQLMRILLRLSQKKAVSSGHNTS